MGVFTCSGLFLCSDCESLCVWLLMVFAVLREERKNKSSFKQQLTQFSNPFAPIFSVEIVR